MTLTEAIKRLRKDTDELMVCGDGDERLINAQQLGIEAAERTKELRTFVEKHKRSGLSRLDVISLCDKIRGLLPSETEEEK